MDKNMQFNAGNKPEELLSSKNHHYMTDSYTELYMKASVLGQTIPILCIDKNGALDIVVDHEYFVSNKGIAHTFRSVLTTHVTDEKETFDLNNQLSAQVLDITNESERDFITAHLPPVKDIQIAKDKESLAQLYEKSYDDVPKTTVYSVAPMTPEMVERLIRDKPINMLGMFQSLWTLFHEKELLLSTKRNVKKLREPLLRIINLLSFAYQSSIITPEDDEEETEEEKIKRKIVKRQIRSLNHPTVLGSALTPPEETALAKFLSRAVEKLTPQEKEIIMEEDLDDTDDDNEDAELPSLHDRSNFADNDDDDDDENDDENDEDLPQDAAKKNSSSVSHKLVESSTAAVADALSKTDPKSTITVEQVMNMHIDAMGTIKDVLKMSGQFNNPSKKGFAGWSTKAKNALLTISSSDPSIPLADISDESKFLINLNSGVKMAIHIKQDLPEGCNWNVDPAMCGNFAKGSLRMNELVTPGGKCEGITIFSCGIDCPFDNNDDNQIIDGIETKLNNGLTCLTSEEIMRMTNQTFSLPTDYLQLCSYFKNNIAALEKFFGEDAHITVESRRFFKSIKKKMLQVQMFTKQYGLAFYFSLLARYHIMQARFINKSLKDPTNMSKSDFNLRNIEDTIEESTFWNIYASPGVTKLVDEYCNKQTNEPRGEKPSVIGNGWENHRSNKNGKRENSNNNNRGGKKATKVINPNPETNSTFNMSDLSEALSAIKAENPPPKVKNCEMCLKWFFLGHCKSNCPRNACHVKVTGSKLTEVKEYKKLLENDVTKRKSE